MNRKLKTILAVLWIAVCCNTAIRAQQPSPLAGQGYRQPGTDKVFVSIAVERLLNVDAAHYMHESQVMFTLSWIDKTAFDTVLAVTAQVQNGTLGQCNRPCASNVPFGGLCCDGIFLPSFTFMNAYGFSQDRQVDDTIYFGPDGEVLWRADVQGTYYQPMTFQHFPFETIDLIVVLEYLDASPLDAIPIEIIPSSASPKVYTLGSGDDSPEWNIEGVKLVKPDVTPLLDRISLYSTQKSAPGDPSPLAPTSNESSWMSGKANQQKLVMVITVTRFWQWNLVTGVLPVVICLVLGLLVFFMDASDLAGRLSVVVTLFLALTAIQFVLAGETPQSSYVQPLQQVILITYLCFALTAIESIMVYNLVNWKRFTEERKKRRESIRKYKRRMSEWKNYKPGKPSASDIPVTAAQSESGNDDMYADAEEDALPRTHDHDDEPIENGIDHQPSRSRYSRFAVFAVFRSRRPQSTHLHGSRKLRNTESFKPTVSSVLAEDPDYGAALAYYVDRVCLVMLVIAYCVAIPVILVTQSGYSPILQKSSMTY